MSEATLRYAATAGAAIITIDNPARRNAMTFGMWSAMAGLVARAADDAAVRVIVLRGAGGKAFCAGADISEFGAKREGGGVARYEDAAAAAEHALRSVEKPTLAVIEGFCFGGGMALAMSCDLRIAADGARFRIPAARLGVGYGFSSIRAIVQKLGPDAVADILFTARVIEADEAGRLGVARIVPAPDLEASVSTVIGQIAANAPLTLASVKRSLVELAKPEADRDLAHVDAAFRACFASEDYREGQRAFLGKREPRFAGR